MILQALYELAKREGLVDDPDYEPKPVAWLVHVGPGGKLDGITGTHYTPEAVGKKKPKPVAKSFNVPKFEGRTSGDKAYFMVDKAEYVFGIDPSGKQKPEKCAKRAELFRDWVKRCAEVTQDEGAQAVAEGLDDITSGTQSFELPEDVQANEVFGFVYTPDIDRLVSDRPAVRDYWKRLRANQAGAEEPAFCLISGETAAPARLIPQLKRVPGANTSGASLVSYNASAFESYGWDHGENASISQRAAEASMTALTRLLDPAYPSPTEQGVSLPKRHIRISADTVVCYWTREAAGDNFADIFGGIVSADPETVGELYRGIFYGRAPRVDDATAFYALLLSGAQGRAVVRDWFESTVAKVADSLASHFADHDLDLRGKEGEPPRPLPFPALVEALASPAKNRSEGIPAPLAARYIRAALDERLLYPAGALQRALQRYRLEVGGADQGLDAARARRWNNARAAIIKAVLNRYHRKHPQPNWKEIEPAMDPNNDDAGYVLGRLIALLERLQSEALGGINAGLVDRYFSGASAAPRSVFPRLMKNARNHAKKLSDNKRGLAFRLERLLDAHAGPFDAREVRDSDTRLTAARLYTSSNFPMHLSLDQQGLFVLGYHQMRRWLWMNKEERAVWEAEHPDVPRAYRWGKTAEETDENGETTEA